MTAGWSCGFAIALTLLGIMPQAVAAPKTLSGTVTYRERIALPPGATIEVKLVDVSRADAPATTIAETSVTAAAQVPIPYALAFDDAGIEPRRRYTLQARITVGGKLWFATTTHHPVLAGGADNTDIVVQRVRAEPDAADAGPTGRWLAEDIRGGGVIDRLQTILEIAPDGAVSGTGGCNRMMGKASIVNDVITFGQIASTQMACTPAAMNQERKFFDALRDVRGWRADPMRRKLILLAADGTPIVVLARM